jgi:predicted aspartyl protease
MQYNSVLFNPPCPAIEVQIEPPVTTRLTTRILAQIDTGADLCVIPDRVIRDLGLVPYRLNRIQEHDGTVASKEVYRIRMIIADLPMLAVDSVHLPFVDDDDYMVLGREGLNKLRLLLDGPAQELSFE